MSNLIDNLKFIGENYKTRGIWFMHFVSLGSPLYSILEDCSETRLIVLQGKSRSGKSTAIKAGLHNWGNAKLGTDGILLTCKSTANSLQERLADKHIFQGINDAQSSAKGLGQSVGEEIYSLTDSVNKGRLLKNSEQQATKSYSGYIALGAEETILDNYKKTTSGKHARVLQSMNEAYTSSADNSDKLLAGFKKFGGNIGRAQMQFLFDCNNGDYIDTLFQRYEYWKRHIRERLKVVDAVHLSLADTFTPVIIANEIWNEWVCSIGFSSLAYDVKKTENFLMEKILAQYYYCVYGLDQRYLPQAIFPRLIAYAKETQSEFIRIDDEKRQICFESKYFNNLMNSWGMGGENIKSILKSAGYTYCNEAGKTTSDRTFTIKDQREHLPAVVLKTDVDIDITETLLDEDVVYKINNATDSEID